MPCASGRHSRSVAIAWLSLIAACSVPPLSEGNDPYANAKFPPLEVAQLRAAALPEGYRLGDRGLAVAADGQRPWRWSQSPNDETLLLRAHGEGDRIDYSQLVFSDASKKTRQWLAAGGVELGALLSLGRARSRDWGRLSQSHAVHERWDVRLYATNVPDLYVQLRAGDVIDAIDWCRDPALLDAADERVRVGDALARLEAAVAAAAWGDVSTWVQRCRPLTGADKARVDAAEARLLAHRAEVNAPVLARIAALQQEHEAAWGAADTFGKVKLYAQNLPRALELTGQLEVESSAIVPRMAERWQELAKQRQEAAQAASAAATLAYWNWARNGHHHEPAAIEQCYVAAVSLDGDGMPLPLALSTRLQLAKPSPPVLAMRGEPDRVARRALARVARQRAAYERGAGMELRADFLEQVVAHDLETLSVPEDVDFPYPDTATWNAVWYGLLDYERARMGEAVAAIDVLQRVISREQADRAARRQRRQPPSTGEPFWRRQLGEQVQRLRRDAEAAAAKGLAATACVLELQAMDAEGGVVDIVQDAVAPTAAAVRHARPLLAEVLPPLELTAPQVHRLCDLLAEGPALSWPIVRLLALGVSPGDALRLRQELQAPVRVVAPVLAGDGSRATLEPVAPGGDHYQAHLAWQSYSGWSTETYREGEWIRGEAAWLQPEKKALDTDEAELEAGASQAEAERTQLDADFAAHEQRRAGLHGHAAIDEFNRQVAELNRRKDAFNQRADRWRQRADAHRQRTATFNQRVGEFNRRLAALNERRMRESAAGAVKTDALLLPALTAALDDGLERWRANLAARGIDDAAAAAELGFARWLFGRADKGPRLWTQRIGRGYCQLQAAAALRLATLQSTNQGYAQKVAAFCNWSLAGQVPERDATILAHIDEFLRHRDASPLIEALRRENGLPPAETKRLLDLIETRRREILR